MSKTLASQKSVASGQSGQLVLEAILLIVVLMGSAHYLTNFLQEKGFAASLISQPWAKLSGMIECGVWSPCAPGLHPQSRDRLMSFHPKTGQL
jgi:hypothetical protein